MQRLNVHFLPELVAADQLAGGTCVVIDVLRATTTIVEALAAGARAVVPCLTIEEARAQAAALPAGEVVLGGERGGLPIAGFDLGNSPAEYTRETVAGKTVVITTTNGTKALLHCRQADEVLAGAFVNLSAVCQRVAHAEIVHLICAGTDGHITREDVLVAGAIVARLSEGAYHAWRLDDSASLARDAWLRIMAHAKPENVRPRLVAAMGESRGGRNLIELGMQRDLEWAAEVDRANFAPRYDVRTGQVMRDAV